VTRPRPRRSSPAAARDSSRRRRAGAAWAALCLGTLLASAPAGGQGVEGRYTLDDAARELSLDEAVAISLEENPDVRSSLFRFDATRAGMWEAYGNFLPRLTLSGGLQRSGAGQFVIGGIVVPTGKTFTTFYDFDVTHRLFDAGRDFFRVDVAQAEREAADAQLAADRQRIAAEVKRAYVAALAAEALTAQRESEIADRQKRLELARARYDLGSVTRSDVLQAQIAVSQAEVDRLTSSKILQTAKLDLLRAMGVTADPDSVRLVEQLRVFEPVFDADSLVELALRESPSLTRLRALRSQRDSENWIAKSAYLPTLQAEALFSSSVSDTSELRFSDFDTRPSYILSLNWELFGGFNRYNETSRAKAELRAAEEAVRAAELAAETGVRQAHLDLLTAYQTHLSKKESVELARTELSLAEERYRIGALSFPDLLASQVTYTAAQTDFIRSGFDFFAALVALEEASGQSLFPPTAFGPPS
jgi:outer membrane protein TolC